jgi:hypothetical protein
MLDQQSMQAVQADYHELIACIDEQETIWKEKMENVHGNAKDEISEKLRLLHESKKSIDELYSIYFDCQEEDWDKVVEKASKAFNLTMRFEGMA